MAMPVDPTYVDRVMLRTGSLERRADVCKHDIAQTQRSLTIVAAELELEFEALARDVADIEKELHRTATRVRIAVAHFRTTGKKADLQRLSARVDLWRPESRITRDQFKRMLADEFS